LQRLDCMTNIPAGLGSEERRRNPWLRPSGSASKWRTPWGENLDRQVKSQGIKAAETQSQWGIPNWTQAENYPNKMTDLEWRWEFVRRRPDYRELWNRRKGWSQVPLDGSDSTWPLSDDVTVELCRARTPETNFCWQDRDLI
jgi:hypothetical protein